MKDLSPHQYEDVYKEDDTPLVDIRKNTYKNLIYFGTVWFVVLILACIFIRFPNEIRLPFDFHIDSDHDIYQFPEDVYIVEHFVETGQSIDSGTALFTISSPAIVTDIYSLNKAQTYYEMFVTNESKIIEQDNRVFKVSIEKQESSILYNVQDLEYLEIFWKEDSFALSAIALDKNEIYESNLRLFNDKAISDFDLRHFKVEKMEASNHFFNAQEIYYTQKLDLNNSIHQSQLEANRLQQKIVRNEMIIAGHIDSLKYMIGIVKNRIQALYGPFDMSTEGLVLKAPKDGQVNFLYDAGKTLSAGTILLNLQYSEPVLYGYSEIPSYYIGRIHKDSKVILEIDAYPHYEWGIAHGLVATLNASTNEVGALPFRISITGSEKLNGLLKEGMSGTCAITIEKKSLFGYLFRKVRKTIHNSIQ